MKKSVFAILLLLILLLPMYAGLQRIRRLPPRRKDEEPPEA